MFGGFIISVVNCVILEVLASLLLPEGKIKKFALSIISVFLFYSIVYPLCGFIKSDGLQSIVFGDF